VSLLEAAGGAQVGLVPEQVGLRSCAVGVRPDPTVASIGSATAIGGSAAPLTWAAGTYADC
jgi:hypothetical protein